MKILQLLMILLMVLSVFTNIHAVNSTDTTETVPISNLQPANQNSYLESSSVDSMPISDWKSSEDNYWKEKMKNDQLTKVLGNISDGLDLSFQNVNAKVSSTNYYTDNTAINIDLDKVFYKPGEQVNYIIQTTFNMSAVSTQLYLAIYNSNNNFYYQYGGYYYRNNNITPFLTSTFSTNSNGFFQSSFTVPTAGQYSIFVSTQPIDQNYYYGSSAYRSITVSDIGIYARIPYYFIPSQPITGYTVILNGTNFSPLVSANVNISYYSFDWSTNTEHLESSWSGQTDANGKVDFSVPTDFSNYYWGYLVITAKQGSVQSTLVRSIWSSYYYNQESGVDFVPTLDKPIYQPGETVHARVLVWNNNYLNASKEPMINEPVTIKLLNPESVLLFQFQRNTDEYGIVTFDLPIDESLSLGTYKLVFEKDNFQQFVDVPIDRYEKPAFRVSINLDKEYVPDGQVATGYVSSQYYFGKPVVNGQVNIKLKTTNGDIRTDVTGKTDNQGLFYFSIVIHAFDTEPQLNLFASVTDPAERTVESTAKIITVSGLFVGAWSSPWTPAPGDQVRVSFYAYQGLNLHGQYYSYYSWEPVSKQNVSIEIKGVNYGLFSNSTTLITTVEGETNQYGYGYTNFVLSRDIVLQYDNFQIVVTLDLQDGRTGSYNFIINYAKVYTNISFDKSSYSSGDTVATSVDVYDLNNNPSKALVSISVFDADYDIIYRGSETVSQSKTYNLKLSQFAPVGDYLVYTIVTYKVQDEYGYIYDRFVYGGQNTFRVGTQSDITLNNLKSTYAAGETITISGSFTSTPQNPVYLEISKRGVSFVNAFVMSSNQFEIQLNNTDNLAPKITMLLFTVLPNGIILEMYKVIEIEQKISVVITTDKENYKPGEEATITVKLVNSNNQSVDGMSVISLIDSSVYGVKSDPLWENDHFTSDDYWSLMATATNWRGFQPIWFYYWYWFDYGIYNLRGFYGVPIYANVGGIEFASDQSKGAPTIDTSQITVRDNLPESMNWQPETYIPKDGLTFKTTLADTIGEWTIRVTATKGSTGVVEKKTFTTSLPFFIEIDKPAIATQDDVITVKGIFYNYLDTDIIANVSITVDESLILNKETQSLRIPENYLSTIRWSVYLPSFGNKNITIYAQTSSNGEVYSDAIRKILVINPNAIEESSVFSGSILPSGSNISLTKFAESVKTSQYMVISKGVNDIILDSWQRLIGYPYGCLEQTMSKLLPDLLVLKYLEQSNNLTDSLRASIEQMIASGIARLYSMQKSNGGFGWFGDDQSNVYMTSYAIYGLNKLMMNNYTSNSVVLTNAVKYLVQNQMTDGHWTADYWYMDDNAFTAFTIRNLAEVPSNISSALASSIAKGILYLKTNWQESQDPYTAALYLLATYGTTNYDASFGQSLLTYLLSNQKIESGEGIYWSTDENYWKPLGGSTETTALVLQALLKVDYSLYYSAISSGLKWLIHQQNPWGWSTTKGTAETLTAIIDFASHSFNSTSGYVDVSVNGVSKTIIQVNNNIDIKPIDIAPYLSTGSNTITLTSSANTTFLYYISSTQMLRTMPSIAFDDKITIRPNSDFTIPFAVILPEENIALKDVKITLLADGWENTSTLTYSAPIIDSSFYSTFNLHSSNQLGTNSIKGIEFEYLLTNKDHSKQSAGNIKEIFGPITLEISNSASVQNLKVNSLQGLNTIPFESYSSTSSSSLASNTFELIKSYSKTKNIGLGDVISVSLTAKALKDNSDQYLYLSDSIPSGFVLDEQSLENIPGITSYAITGSSLTFFISEMSKDSSLVINYKLQAKTTILASIAPTAFISSMYNDSVKVYSNSIVLGSNILRRSLNGAILTDKINPELTKLQYTIHNQQISFHVEATDSEGIGDVNIFFKEQNWQSIGLQSTTTNNFDGSIQVSNVAKITYYVQVQDVSGNNYESELLTILIPVVEIGLVIGVLFITGIISVAGYKTSKRYILKKGRKIEESNEH